MNEYLSDIMSSSKAAIQAVVQTARRTFSRKFQNFVLNPEEFSASLNELKKLLDGLRACDVGLDKSHALKSTAPSMTAPVTYIKIHEDQDVSIGIFLVKGGQKIPLHNHPKMHGLLKVSKFVKFFYVPCKNICQIRQVSLSTIFVTSAFLDISKNFTVFLNLLIFNF